LTSEEKLRQAIIIASRKLEELKNELIQQGEYELATHIHNMIPDLIRYYASGIGRSEYTEFMSKCLKKMGKAGTIGKAQEHFRKCALQWNLLKMKARKPQGTQEASPSSSQEE